MIAIDRTGTASPVDWIRRVDRSLPDPAGFWREATAFEAIPFGDPRRDDGFYVFAPTMLKRRKSKREFPAVWNRAGVRPMLVTQARRKCAYCEANPSWRERQLDHFRPKKLFPMLAYDVWNLFLACATCNVVKLDKWPTGGAWIRPDDGSNPTSRFVFGEDGSVTAAPGDTVAQRTIDDIGLDCDEYRERRRLAIEERVAAVRRALKCKLPVAFKAELARQQLVSENQPYSAAINQCVRRVWEARYPASPI